MKTISSKPYILRALREWVIDSGNTPYMMVQIAAVKIGAENIPASEIHDGIVTLNISPCAVVDLTIGDTISFGTKFNGIHTDIAFLAEHVMTIFAQETMGGMNFQGNEVPSAEAPEEPVKSNVHRLKAKLRIVK